MLGGIGEAAIVAAIGGAFAKNQKDEVRKTEEDTINTAYKRFFKRNLAEVASATPTEMYPDLSVHIDDHAKTCIHMIEDYQKARSGHILGVAIRKRFEGDIRTLVFEEMKLWLSTVTTRATRAQQLSPKEVMKRLEYCRQIIIRGSEFDSYNERSFVGTMAEVSIHLEKVLLRVSREETGSKTKIENMMRSGLDAVIESLNILLFALTSNALADGLPRHEPPIQVGHAALIDAAKNGSGVLDWKTDLGMCLQALLTTEYLRNFVTGSNSFDSPPANNVPVEALTDKDNAQALMNDVPEEAQLEQGININLEPPKVAPRGFGGGNQFGKILKDVKTRWGNDLTVGPNSGLVECFCGQDSKTSRMALLDFMHHLDRLIMFLAELKPYERLAGIQGDIAMCILYERISTHLQQLEDALVQHRLARVDVMNAANWQLQANAKNYQNISGNIKAIHWMQGLRNINGQKLDDLYCSLINACTELRRASTVNRAYELWDEYRHSIADIQNTFESPDFQSRCQLRPPPATGMTGTMALTSGSAEPSKAIALAPA